MSRLACCLLVILAIVPTAGVVTAGAPDGASTAATTTVNATATETATPDRTVMASDGTFGGFTLGAAILAVLVAGSYRYLRG
ncbi:hypothetical protein [Halorientalis regularis]|uniref:Uncharacterized protein n=1 Tax=Halorientalis regularis TaxID=660518 RepID=A0A1G7G0V9_9EURY|nr:hypothetical protein [Halorientalis regularis]SDE81665.1 hypothetical protein SAMN05216218_101439 [Halorientalis regularis]